MKILFIVPELSGGGIGTFYREQLKAFVEYGNEVDVLITGNKVDLEYESQNKGINFLNVAPYKEAINISSFPLINATINKYIWLQDVLRDNFYDIIEIAEFGMSYLPKIGNAPLVLQLHGSQGQIEYHDHRDGHALESLFLQSLERDAYGKSDAILAYSKKNQNDWQIQLNRKIDYIPPVFTAPELSRHYIEEDFGLVLGRVQHWKGPHILCEAVKELKVNKDFKLYWVGGDNYYKSYGKSMSGYLKQQYPDIWGKVVIPTGRLPYANAQEFISKAAFVLVPSLWDTFNFTLIEGMARGKVIAASDGAGATQWIENGQNGFSFTANNAQSMAETIEDILSLNEIEKKAMQQNALETVRENLSVDKIIPKRINHFNSVIRGFVPYEYKLENSLVHLEDCFAESEKLLDKLPLSFLTQYMIDRLKKKILK